MQWGALSGAVAAVAVLLVFLLLPRRLVSLVRRDGAILRHDGTVQHCAADAECRSGTCEDGQCAAPTAAADGACSPSSLCGEEQICDGGTCATVRSNALLPMFNNVRLPVLHGLASLFALSHSGPSTLRLVVRPTSATTSTEFYVGITAVSGDFSTTRYLGEPGPDGGYSDPLAQTSGNPAGALRFGWSPFASAGALQHVTAAIPTGVGVVPLARGNQVLHSEGRVLCAQAAGGGLQLLLDDWGAPRAEYEYAAALPLAGHEMPWACVWWET